VIRLADQCDVLVVGAGLAGSTAAQRLASHTHKLFAFLGQLNRIEAAGLGQHKGHEGVPG
jgi:monoamine oxidase